MIRRPPRSTLSSSSAASDVYKRQKAAREDVRPAAPQPAAAAPQRIAPQQFTPRQGVPQQVYARPAAGAPEFGSPAKPAQQASFDTPQRLLDWVSNYRKHPDLWRVPDAVHAMLDFGLFGDEEKQWFCIGFIAGILGANPNDGPALVTRMFPMPDKEQEVIIRAIVYSGRPDWRSLLAKNSSRMPLRGPLIDDFL